MKKNLSLNVIYKTLADPESDFGVEIIYLFNETGFMDSAEVLEQYHRFFRNEPSLLFRNLDELGDFVRKFIEEIEAPNAFILSVEDYNGGLERVREKAEYQQFFQKVGTKLENQSFKPSSSSGILGKIFS